MATPRFWLQIVMIYVITFSLRFSERAARWLFYPNDSMVLAELERVVHSGHFQCQRNVRCMCTALRCMCNALLVCSPEHHSMHHWCTDLWLGPIGKKYY